jgi:Ni/Fe-hydrogenase subunit HybB-like protein
VSLFVIQVLVGMILPLGMLIAAKARQLSERGRRFVYLAAVILIQLGIFSTRWNVVIGGQLFSKSFRGLMTYKMEVLGLEGLITAVALLIAPFIILTILLRVLPVRRLEEQVSAVGR